jgi:hypothetical protein
MFSFGLQTHITPRRQVYYTSEFCKLRKPDGSDQQQLSDVIIPPTLLVFFNKKKVM